MEINSFIFRNLFRNPRSRIKPRIYQIKDESLGFFLTLYTYIVFPIGFGKVMVTRKGFLLGINSLLIN